MWPKNQSLAIAIDRQLLYTRDAFLVPLLAEVCVTLFSRCCRVTVPIESDQTIAPAALLVKCIRP